MAQSRGDQVWPSAPRASGDPGCENPLDPKMTNRRALRRLVWLTFARVQKCQLHNCPRSREFAAILLGAPFVRYFQEISFGAGEQVVVRGGPASAPARDG